MAQKRKRKSNIKAIYSYDSTARALDPVYDLPEVSPAYVPRRRYSRKQQRRRNLRPAPRTFESLLYSFIVVAAICVVSYVLTSYIALQSDITARQHNITVLESNLNDLKLANDEEYARIVGAVDLEQIKQVAMEDLGMTYPAEGQMVSFSDNESDYVRQYSDIP